MSEEKVLNVPAPNVGPALSDEAEQQWLSQEAAWQRARISDLEDMQKRREARQLELTKEHNAWMGHVSTCNRTNLATSIAMVVMALVTTGLVLAVIAKLV